MAQRESIVGRLKRYFVGCSYTQVDLHSEQMSLFYLVRDDCAYLVWLMENEALSAIDRDSYIAYHNTIRERFLSQNFKTVQMLTLFFTSDSGKVKEIADGNAFWIVDEAYGRLIVYENQPEDYLGIRGMIEQNLHFGADIRNFDGKQQTGIVDEPGSSGQNKKTENSLKGRRLEFGMFVLNQFRYLFTIIIVISNIVIFFFSDEDVLIRFGNQWRWVFEDGEYYRLFTSVFLHLDSEHIISNMLILLLIGMELEKRMGHIWFLITYMASGLFASLASCWYHQYMHAEALCIGASGAIYGIVGAIILVVFLDERSENRTAIRIRLCLFAAYMIYGIYSSSGMVDNAAHVGGFVAGTIIALVYQYLFLGIKNRIKQKASF